jgi:hypothetical protein
MDESSHNADGFLARQNGCRAGSVKTRTVAARLELWLSYTQLEYPRLGLVEVLDFEVEVSCSGTFWSGQLGAW